MQEVPNPENEAVLLGTELQVLESVPLSPSSWPEGTVAGGKGPRGEGCCLGYNRTDKGHIRAVVSADAVGVRQRRP